MKYTEDKIISMVKATQGIEGIKVSERTEDMARQLIRGKKTKKELIEEIKQSHRHRVANRILAHV